MRQSERIELIYYLRVFDRTAGETAGYLVNVNSEGIMLISEHPLVTGKKGGFAMDLPGHVGRGQQLTFEGEVIWSRSREGTPFYNSGIRLLAITGEDREILARMMQDYDSEGIGLNLSDETNPPEILEGSS